MKHAELVKTLNALKGGSTWRDIAKLSGVHYDTVVRVARCDEKDGMPNPSVHTVEKIAEALEKLIGKRQSAEA